MALNENETELVRMFTDNLIAISKQLELLHSKLQEMAEKLAILEQKLD